MIEGTLHPWRDDALLVEVDGRVVDAIRRESARDERGRKKAVRNRARKALGTSGPAQTAKTPKVAASTKPKPEKRRMHPTRGRGVRLWVAKESNSRRGIRLETDQSASERRPHHVPGEALCHDCLRDDADQRDEWAEQLAAQGTPGAANRESSEAERLRALISVSVNKACRFHAGAPRRARRPTPEPTIHPPGIRELARMEEAAAMEDAS